MKELNRTIDALALAVERLEGVEFLAFALAEAPSAIKPEAVNVLSETVEAVRLDLLAALKDANAAALGVESAALGECSAI